MSVTRGLQAIHQFVNTISVHVLKYLYDDSLWFIISQYQTYLVNRQLPFKHVSK